MKPELQLLFLMALLQIKHCYADFVLQSYMQTVKKGEWLNPIGISHSIEHGICTLIALMLFCFFVPITVGAMIVVTILEVISHYLIDYSKVKYGCKDTSSSLFWTQFGLDQLLHQLTYIAICWLLIFEY